MSQNILPNPWRGQAIVARCSQDVLGNLVLSPAANPRIHKSHASAVHQLHQLTELYKTSFAVLTVSTLATFTPKPVKTYRVALMRTEDLSGNTELTTAYSADEEAMIFMEPSFVRWLTDRQTLEV